MKKRNTYDVIAIGLSKLDVKILKAIFQSAEKNYDYSFQLTSGKGAENAHFAIVNADEPQIVRKWRVWNARSNPIYSIYASKVINEKGSQTSILKPFNPASVMKGMQHAMFQVYGEIPDFEISESVKPSNNNDFNSVVNKVNRSKVTALVVDDCHTILKAMAIQLDLLGIHATCVSSGEAALERIKKIHYDLIFLDIVLPGIDGYDLCKEIRATSIHKNTPVCMLTGKSNMFNMVRAKLAGCDKYITKPANSSTLSQAILKMLNITSFKQLKSA
ncbi:response regulator [Aliikangiella sp. IMCC44359]|uniref:response regulator n=1 Tax=Aliikangiella sp. IMCC44359 TaxID=3459125 RepID=UPI00403B0B5C